MDKTVFIPILTRNHNNYLKHYLRCIDELDYPKDKIVIYINTNNNADAQWEPPVAMPTDGKMYSWDESTTSWTEITR